MINEIWKDITGYEGIYEVSDRGNIRNKKTGRLLKPVINSNGYTQVRLFNNCKGKTCRIHRLVAETFIPNPYKKPCIDHIDTNKTNNDVTNLRWCNQKENLDNPITREKLNDNRIKAHEYRKKKIKCITNGEIFESAAEATRYYNIKYESAVRHAANPNHAQKTAGKLSDGTKLEWKYI